MSCCMSQRRGLVLALVVGVVGMAGSAWGMSSLVQPLRPLSAMNVLPRNVFRYPWRAEMARWSLHYRGARWGSWSAQDLTQVQEDLAAWKERKKVLQEQQTQHELPLRILCLVGKSTCCLGEEIALNGAEGKTIKQAVFANLYQGQQDIAHTEHMIAYLTAQLPQDADVQ